MEVLKGERKNLSDSGSSVLVFGVEQEGDSERVTISELCGNQHETAFPSCL